MPSISNRVLPASILANLPDSISAFELSPDQGTLLIAGVGTSTVHTVSLSGEHQVIQGKDRGNLRWMPTWRNNEEICLVTEDDSGTAQVTLQSGESAIHLSKDWADELRKTMTEDRSQSGDKEGEGDESAAGK